MKFVEFHMSMPEGTKADVEAVDFNERWHAFLRQLVMCHRSAIDNVLTLTSAGGGFSGLTAGEMIYRFKNDACKEKFKALVLDPKAPGNGGKPRVDDGSFYVKSMSLDGPGNVVFIVPAAVAGCFVAALCINECEVFYPGFSSVVKGVLASFWKDSQVF